MQENTPLYPLPYENTINERQGLVNIGNTDALAFTTLGIGGAVAAGLGFIDAGIRRNTLKTDLDAANARIVELEANIKTACSDLQGIVDTILNLEALTAGTPSLFGGFISGLSRSGDLLIEGRQAPGQALAATILKAIRHPLPLTVCV